MNNYTFEKRWINEEETEYEIWYIDLATGASTKRIDESKPLYQEWLALGRSPTEIEFVPPPEPEPSEDWDGFEAWCEANLLAKFITTPGIIPAWVLNELVTHDLSGIKTALGAAIQTGLVSFSAGEKAAINSAAASFNIGNIFEV